MPSVLVRRPGPLLPHGLLTHLERTEVDIDLATQQWEGYVRALADNGWSPIEVSPADSCADAVFIEDAVVMFGELAVITRPGDPSRRPETPPVEVVVAGLGYRIATIQGPGTLDGGDVLKVGTTVYVGLTLRTNQAGIDQLAALVADDGYNVVAVPTTKVLHLKSAVTALPDGTVIGYFPVVDDPALFDNFLAVPEETGAHVVDLGDNRLLIAANCPKTTRLLSERGYEMVTVDVTEFEKLEGCVTCLSVRLRGDPETSR